MELEEQRQLVEKAKNDMLAFGELYEQYYSPILGYILRRTGRLEIAQDITSEVFYKALNNLHQFRWRDVPFSSWLYRIAGNEVVNYFRNNHNHSSLDNISDSISDPDSTVENEIIEAEAEIKRHEDYLALHESISKLPAKYQEVITLRYFEHKQLREISLIMGKREGTIKSLLHRGIERLRVIMK